MNGYTHYYSQNDFKALKLDKRAAILQARKDNNHVPGENPGQNVDALEQLNVGDDASQISTLAGRTIKMDRSLVAGVIAATTTN